MSAADVLKLIKEKGVKFVDLRLTDTRGKEQHVTVPAPRRRQRLLRRRQDVRRLVDRRLEGHQRVRHDPDAAIATTAVLDVFTEEPTLNIRCDVIEPSTMQGYERDPRSAAKRAEAYHALDGHRRRGVLRSRERVLHLRRRALGVARCSGAFYAIDSYEGCVAERQGDRGRQHRPPPGHQGRLLPGAARRLAAGHPLGDVPRARGDGPRRRGAPPRGRDGRPVRDRREVRLAREEGRRRA